MGKKLRLPRIRTMVQATATLLTNGWLPGFINGNIFKGATKSFCVPGLNCYSCPGALGSCPIGALQSTLTSREFKLSLYVSGFLFIVGSLLGRFVCGFLCPFGWLQELFHKIPFPKKLKKLPGERILRWLKYLILTVFVILLPLFFIDATGIGKPWFCAYICPAGTLEAGIPLVLANRALQSILGFLYAWKIAILIVLILLSLMIWRPFCRYLCPLGAIYGLFNPIALLRFKINRKKCTDCGGCQKACPMELSVMKKPNSLECMRCGKCRDACPTDAIEMIYPFKKEKQHETN